MLESATNLELLIELMYEGKSEIVESLASDEPIETQNIVEILADRTGRDPDDSFDVWYEWFVSEGSGESEADKEILRNLLEFKCQFDGIVRKIKERREDPN